MVLRLDFFGAAVLCAFPASEKKTAAAQPGWPARKIKIPKIGFLSLFLCGRAEQILIVDLFGLVYNMVGFAVQELLHIILDQIRISGSPIIGQVR